MERKNAEIRETKGKENKLYGLNVSNSKRSLDIEINQRKENSYISIYRNNKRSLTIRNVENIEVVHYKAKKSKVIMIDVQIGNKREKFASINIRKNQIVIEAKKNFVEFLSDEKSIRKNVYGDGLFYQKIKMEKMLIDSIKSWFMRNFWGE